MLYQKFDKINNSNPCTLPLILATLFEILVSFLTHAKVIQ